MKILIIGDIVGNAAIDYLSVKLRRIKETLDVSFTVANGENASEIHGISSYDAKAIFECGVDLITLGNHTYGKRDVCQLLSDRTDIIRPANYPPTCPGGGYTLMNVDGYRILCMNVLGTALMEPMSCPFSTIDRILERENGNYDISLLDIHAETTSEKIAMGRYFDGRINIIFGTHTHVPTADEQILPRGTAYITDVGMTGPTNGVIGSDASAVIEKFRTKMPVRFTVADGEIKANCLLVDINASNGKVSSVRRVNF